MSRRRPDSRFHKRLSNREWEALRREVFERDGWRCRHCGKAGRLECDHIVPMERAGAALDIANLQTLCRGCHFEKTAAERGHSDPGADAWRELVSKLAGKPV